MHVPVPQHDKATVLSYKAGRCDACGLDYRRTAINCDDISSPALFLLVDCLRDVAITRILVLL